MKQYIFTYKDKNNEQIQFITTDHVKAMGAAAAFVTNCSFSMEILESQETEAPNE